MPAEADSLDDHPVSFESDHIPSEASPDSKQPSATPEIIFAADYDITKRSNGLQTLTEEAGSTQQFLPTFSLSPDEENMHSSDTVPDLLPSPMLGSFSEGQLTAPGTPAGRRRSSAAGHRKRSSIHSLNGFGGTDETSTRRRSSMASTVSRTGLPNPEQLPDDDEFGEFGEFDDYVEGDFDVDDDYEALNNNFTQKPEDFPSLDNEDAVHAFTRSAINSLFGYQENASGPITPLSATFENKPDEEAEKPDGEPLEEEEEDSPFMLTDRAVSLWKQLTAPPPLQPPDWKRSRMRRLFLVSLGIPVDLDEILPKMTHKKLVLPSTRKHREKKSSEERKSRRKVPPPPEFEVPIARQICSKTRAALEAMDERDLQLHVNTLKAHTTAASELLTYWLEQRDAAQSDKETFEAVVANLVRYHKKQKDEQKEKASATSKKTKSRFSIRG